MAEKTIINTVISSYRFRSICEADKDSYLSVKREASEISVVHQQVEGFSDFCWEEDLKDENNLFMVVFREADKQFVAICSFQKTQSDAVELGCDVKKEYRNQGMGTQIVRALILLAHSTYPEKQILIKVRKGNFASLRVIEKCGGKLTGSEDTPEVKYFQQQLRMVEKVPSIDKAYLKKAIERGRNGIKVFEI